MPNSVLKIGAVGASSTFIGGAGSALLLALAASPAGAVPTVWTVDTLADGAATAADCTTPVPNSCSLRDALAAATTGDTIEFSASLFTGGAGTITLTNGALINDGITIRGPGADLLTVNANSASRVFEVGIASTTLSGMTITGGTSADSGGGIKSPGDLILDHMVVTGNSAESGAGILVVGELELIDSTISSNVAVHSGGGVVGLDSATITRSTISGNLAGDVGAGVYIYGSTTVTDSTISGNTATGGVGGGIVVVGALSISGTVVTGNASGVMGGGMYVYGPLTMNGSTVSGNTASSGAGLHAHGATSIVGSTFNDNEAVACGGALYFGDSDSTLSILNSTFAGNEATNCAGGAVYVYGPGTSVTIANSTFTANTAVTGGALRFAPEMEVKILMSTITGNIATNTNEPEFYSGGGIHMAAGRPSGPVFEGSLVAPDTTSSLEMSGVILAGNIAQTAGTGDLAIGARDFPGSGTVTATNSMIGTITTNITLDGANLLRDTNPMLGALTNNGGPTFTMSPLAGSPLIDAGPATIPVFPGNEFDQRGIGFARILGATSDIGAIEVQVAEPVVPVFTG